MKTLADIDKTLLAFEKKFGLTVRGHEQLSPAWFDVKLGVVSGSNASRAVAKKTSETRLTYMAQLVAQVCAGAREESNFKQTDWGNQHEKAARSSVEFATGYKITPLTFVFKDDSFRVGCSPDGLIGNERPTEIKCPWDSANYVKFIVGESVKPEWQWQNQFNLWVLGADEIDLTQYDPRMKTKPLHTVTVQRDPDYTNQLAETIPEFILDMDKMLAKLGVKFGDQWLRIAENGRESA